MVDPMSWDPEDAGINKSPLPEAESTMLYWLGKTLRSVRGDIAMEEVVSYMRMLSAPITASKLSRLEDGKAYPRGTDKLGNHSLDQIVAAYADLLGIDGREIWVQALTQYRELGRAPTVGSLTPQRRALLLLARPPRQGSPPADSESR